MKKISLILWLALAGAWPGRAESVALNNASFESPFFGGGNGQYLVTDGLGTGWTFSSPGLTGSSKGGIAGVSSPWTTTTPDGSQAAFLQGATTVSQRITIPTTGTYYVNFLAANRPGFPADNLALQVDGATVGSWPSANFSGGNFINLNLAVTFTAGTHVLAFVGATPGGDAATVIDQVSINKPNFTLTGTNVIQSDGSDVDTQLAINAAGDGYTIQLPAGNFLWKTGVKTYGKAIKIAGAGAGALFGHSTTPVPVGAGLKNFIVSTNGWAEVTNGMTVTAYYTAAGEAGGVFGNAPTNMTGTVVSFDGTTLGLNVTSFRGGGVQAFWTLGTASKTVITNSCTKGPAFNLFEPVTGNIEVSGVRIIASGANSAIGDGIDINDGPGMALIHDCWFTVANVGSRAIESRSNHGLVYRCSFDNKFDGGVNHNGNGNNDQALTFKALGLMASWVKNSTMGMDDVGGTNNFYVEDCYEVGFWTGGTDFDDNSRVVVRNCIFNNSVCSSHGLETSPFGLRHFELYNNNFIFTDVGAADFNLNWWLFLRGGTGVIFSNTMPNIISSTWGDKGELTFCVMFPYRLGCSTNYPAPHQIGQSMSNGVPITDPVYYWNNAGLPGSPGLAGYPAGQADSCYSVNSFPAGKPDESNAPPIANFLKAGRDFVNTPKPGYLPYTYPHPLRVSDPARIEVPVPPATNPLAPPEQLKASGSGQP